MSNQQTRARYSRLQILSLYLLLFLIPLSFVVDSYQKYGNSLGLIQFGAVFESRQLPEVKELHPPLATSPQGYDGQFYAQIAIDPSLQHPALNTAVDHLAWRGKRIGLPAISYLLGFGQSKWILTIYTLLNLVCWLALLYALHTWFGASDRRVVFLIFAILCCTGSLVSVQRALTDLPALLFALLALYASLAGWTRALLLGFSGLFKETALLSAPALFSFSQNDRTIQSRPIISLILIVLPLGIWWGYIHSMVEVDKVMESRQLLTWPLLGISTKLIEAFRGLVTTQSLSSIPNIFFELLAPVGIFIQAVYLLIYPQFKSPTWRWGIAFAILMLCLGPRIWEEQAAYCRIILPLTAVFNLLIFQQLKGKKYWIWYIAGNLGMMAMCLYAIRIYSNLIF